MIPTFYDKDSYGSEWCYDNKDINQHLAAPTAGLFYENFDNRDNDNVTRINEYPKWRPANFEENIYGTNYSGLGSQG